MPVLSQDNVQPSSSERSSQIMFDRDIIAVVETNVDDATGEILGRTIERLMAEGAYDATVFPYVSKKERIGQTVRIFCSPNSVEKFAQILVEETGTFGVKTQEYTRLIVPRRIVPVPVVIRDFKGSVNVKVAHVNGRMRFKPEVSEAQKISDSQKIPLRDVLDVISDSARKYFEAGRMDVNL